MTHQTNEESKYAVVEIVSGKEGQCLIVNDLRVAGPKPWGGGTVIKRFQVKKEDLMEAIDCE